MPLSSDPYSFHNYVHELTHLLTPKHSDWVSEGLAVYLNDKWGGEGGYPNYVAEIDQVVHSYLNRPDIIENIGDETYYPSRSDLRNSVGEGFYILSGSFVKYVIEKTGIESFMRMYNAPDMQEGMEKLTKKTLQEWKTEWLDHLLGLKEA
jgi:predicted metal-dependent hydrolase